MRRRKVVARPKAVRKPRRLPDGRKRSDYPCEVTINLSEKQMAYAQWCADQLYFNVEHFIYTASVNAVLGWWKVMPDDVKARIAAMDV